MARRTKVYAVVRVELGPCYQDCLAQSWSAEASTLRQGYYHRACDAFTLHVRDVWKIAAWEPDLLVTECAREQHAWNPSRGNSVCLTEGALKRLNNTHMFLATNLQFATLTGAPCLEHVSLQRLTETDYIPLSRIIAEDKIVPRPCLRVPSPVLDLLLEGAWRDLVMLARWSSRLPDLQAQLDSRWAARTRHMHEEPPPQQPLSAESTDMILKHFRAFASTAITSVPDEEAAEALRARGC